jgi:hypothetical protein
MLIAVGMTLGFVGDLFLADLVPQAPSVLAGMGAFGLGHLGYIVALMQLSNQQNSGINGPGWIAIAFWILVGLIGWIFIAFLSDKPPDLRWGALAYTLLLASAAGYATALALRASAIIPVAVGLFLFFTSDMILAAQLFRKIEFPLISSVVWLTYGPAQMLIVFGGNRAATSLTQSVQKPTEEPINVEAMFTSDSSLDW